MLGVTDIGSEYLSYPGGQLTAAGLGTIGNKEIFTLECPDWSLDNMGKRLTQTTTEFQNNIYSQFKMTIGYDCNYLTSTAPSFKTSPEAFVIEHGA